MGLEDACPHRKLPLSKGRIKGDHLECGYHGLTFDCAGQCVWAPGHRAHPVRGQVHAYPLHEKYGLVWIWMGNPALADASDIFEIENYDDPSLGHQSRRRDGAGLQLSVDVRQSAGPDPCGLGA